MIFSGDIACPNKKALPEFHIPKELKELNWVSNLEGGVVLESINYIPKKNVFNDFETLQILKDEFNIAAFALANNHITDSSAITNTKRALNELNISSVGAGNNLNEAASPIYLSEDGKDITLLNFGWQPIGCKLAKPDKEGVNPFTKKNVINAVLESKKEFPTNKLILFFHWNYELELYPQPHDRDLSKQLIDLGADAVIGCHAHRVQGAEIYKGKPIIYGLGNWIFARNAFWNGRLKFPNFCNLQLAFEIDWTNDRHICHWFSYNTEQNSLEYLDSEELSNSKRVKELSPYSSLSSFHYKKWFLNNRVQKKFLPVFYYDDSDLNVFYKNLWIKYRHLIIMILVYLKLKN